MKSSHFSLKELKTYKENSRLEVKLARGGLPNSLWESYSAFANSDGGVIVLGVKENRDGSFFVEGLVDSHKLIKDFWNAVNNRQKVSCNILTDSMAYLDSVDGKDVIVIHVPRAERTSRPVYVGADPRTGTYRRNGEGDYHCTIEEPYVLRESVVVYGSNDTVNDSEGDTVNEFAGNIGEDDTVNDTESDTVNEFAGNVVANDTVNDTVNINIDTVNDTARLILQCIIENPKITYEGIVDRTTIPRATVARNISKLKVSGYIIRHDADKNGYWEVLKNY